MPAETTMPDYAGGCLCGDVQWASSEPPRLQFNCYCIDCRKSTGAAFMPLMFFKAQSVRLSGELTRYTSTGGSGHAIERGFCSRCGAQVLAEVALMPGLVSIRAGTLADIHLFEPKASIFVSQAPDWAAPRDDLPAFERLPSISPSTRQDRSVEGGSVPVAPR